MDRSYYWKTGFITAVTLLAAWLLVPTYYYFKLPPEERNNLEKLQASLPSWAPSAKTRLNLGLDLQGGIHLVLGVDTQTALKSKVARRADQIVTWAEQDKKLSGVTAVSDGLRVKVTVANPADREQVQKSLLEDFQDMHLVGTDDASFTVAYQDQFLADIKGDAVDQALKVIANRVNAWGVTEPIIAKRGENAILVQLPGFKDPAKAKELLGETAQLEFKLVDDESPFFSELKNLPEGVALEYDRYEGPGGAVVSAPYLTAQGENGRKVLEQYLASAEPKVPEGHEVGYECIPSKTKKNACDGYRTYLLRCKAGSGANECLAPITGDTIVDARALIDQSQGGNGKPYVALTFDKRGGDDFARITGENVRKRFAIVLDKTVNSTPVINEKIPSGRASITMGGLKPFQELSAEANELALVLKAGALPAPVTIAEERSVGASLGPELIRSGSLAALVGLALVLIFMAFYYRVSGLVANVALVLNGLFVLAMMALFNATLTLPGIAGFVLTLGMAVDANVLINERIREELRTGKTPRAALEAGYGRAFWTIFDANLTTLIAGFVLLNYGSGPVRGFAVMLIIGLLASMFTAIVVTRAIMDWMLIGRGWNKALV